MRLPVNVLAQPPARLVRAAVLWLLWLVLVPALRLRARRRLARLLAGEVTIVTVNWNSSEHLRVFLRVVTRRTPSGTQVIVVDNGSRDDSREVLAHYPRVRSLLLPINLGHSMALDIGFLCAKTEYVVALDVDAFPLRDDWLEQLIAPLSSGKQIAGARMNRQYVHPCCLAMRTARFVEQRHSFRSRYRPRAGGRDAFGDVGEEMSARERDKLYFFDPTSQRGPGDIGTVFGDLVYHNFYATRAQANRGRVLDDVVREDDVESAWNRAVQQYDV